MTLDVYDQDELAESAFARCLITGDPKAGKTTTVLTTAPGPILVLNCDRPGAPMAAKRHGAKFKTIDIESTSIWQEACRYAVAEAAAGNVRTVVVDTITMLINNTIALEMKRKFTNFDIWRETYSAGMSMLNMLHSIQAHLFILAHFNSEDGLIALQGSLKKDVPALVHDRVHLEFKPKGDPKRVFLVGPSASGLSGGRNSDESKVIVADVKVLLEELGLKP